jgi:hypothetical protein
MRVIDCRIVAYGAQQYYKDIPKRLESVVVFVTGYPHRKFGYPIPVPVISHPREAGTCDFQVP